MIKFKKDNKIIGKYNNCDELLVDLYYKNIASLEVLNYKELYQRYTDYEMDDTSFIDFLNVNENVYEAFCHGKVKFLSWADNRFIPFEDIKEAIKTVINNLKGNYSIDFGKENETLTSTNNNSTIEVGGSIMKEDKEKLIQKVKDLNAISLSSILEELGYDKANFYYGRLNYEKTKLIHDTYIQRIKDTIKEK